MPTLVSIKTAFPKYEYEQQEIIEALKKVWSNKVNNLKRLESIQQNVQVGKRSLSMPLEDYLSNLSFGERNHCFINTALDLAQKATVNILEEANLDIKEIRSIWSNTITGFAIPSIEARLMNKLPFNTDTKRIPLLGLGCMAGVAGINRVMDYLKAYPKEAALFISVECCSLTFQIDDISVANLVSTGLFGDGGAALLLAGDEHPLSQNAPLQFITSESIFFPDTEDVMGWDVGENGLKIILNKNVPDVTEKMLPPHLNAFLDKQKISLKDIKSFFAHPGGPKVLQSLEKVLELPEHGLKFSWESLNQRGNMSSVSVIDIIERHLKNYEENQRDVKGELAMSLAMGPAFSSEIGLFKWN